MLDNFSNIKNAKLSDRDGIENEEAADAGYDIDGYCEISLGNIVAMETTRHEGNTITEAMRVDDGPKMPWVVGPNALGNVAQKAATTPGLATAARKAIE
ncbi:unnamed protein product [Caenorhabditis bovis]|uniref:Uncharacterized protein n=1 Tax=Caenorhabditis bovis TaxID=2654633 RepID=A0A8S1F9M8_9PELO|nr:unnamed protein product [Caenorhabditis bovis]